MDVLERIGLSEGRDPFQVLPPELLDDILRRLDFRELL